MQLHHEFPLFHFGVKILLNTLIQVLTATIQPP